MKIKMRILKQDAYALQEHMKTGNIDPLYIAYKDMLNFYILNYNKMETSERRTYELILYKLISKHMGEQHLSDIEGTFSNTTYYILQYIKFYFESIIK